MLLDPYQSVIFDCDGVILDSNGMKSEAFRKSLEGEDPKLIDQFILYHQENGGVSRYVKFLHFYGEMKRAKDYQEQAKKTMRVYSNLSRAGLLTSAEIPGARDLLNYLRGKEIPCFVISGGDQLEVCEVLERRDLSDYFQEILGSPLTKKDNLDLLRRRRLLRSPALYFGDAASDLEAAQTFSLDFIFVAARSEWRKGRQVVASLGLPIVEDLRVV